MYIVRAPGVGDALKAEALFAEQEVVVLEAFRKAESHADIARYLIDQAVMYGQLSARFESDPRPSAFAEVLARINIMASIVLGHELGRN
jgi:hypothetical protein